MEPMHKEILEKLHEKITDINVDNGIVSFLQFNGILTDSDIDAINRTTHRIDKATTLLNILPERGSRAFDCFYQSLKKHYNWLSDEMLRMTAGEEVDSRGCTSPIMPAMPTFTVVRAEKLRHALRNLLPGSYVVLHGMKGYGRTRLTALTLDDGPLVNELFNNEIYWIKFGSEGANTVEDEILTQLQQLYDKVEKREVSLNLGKLKDEMCSMLKRHFNLKHNSLLILDDAYDKKIIEVFNFGCKTLVITTDTEILSYNNNVRKEVIKMEEGFTEAESLDLFARSLDIQVDLLPSEAKDIHYECNGMPILIDMFAAQFKEFKEDMIISRYRWQYYLKALRKKDASNAVMEKFLRNQSNTFDVCIGRLEPYQREYYKSLAIFSEDINIMPKTLEVLWNESKCKVEDILLSLCRKSLVVRYWNFDLKSYIYGVHDLLLRHLRSLFDKRKLSSMHREFVKKFYTICKNDFSKFPKDNYTYAYIGYHLEQAEMFREFQKLYLNFNFIQNKINNSGVNDLLIDLKKYRDHITDNDENIERKVRDLEEFLQTETKTLAEYRQRDCLDLVQIALNHPRGYCYETARSIAQSQKNKLYLKNTHQRSELHNPIAEELNMEFSTVNFTDNPNQILIGTKTGLIMLWNCDKKKHRPFYAFEKSKIVKVIVSQNGKFFIALNSESIVKYFTLTTDNDDDDDDENENELYDDYSDNNHSHTPRDKQTFWYPIVPRQTNTSSVTYDTNGELITDMTLSSDDKRLAVCTAKGTIIVWDVDGKQKASINEKNTSFQKLTFVKESRQLHVVDTKGTITVYLWDGNSYDYKTRYHPFPRGVDESSFDIEVIYLKEKIDQDETIVIYLTRDTILLIKWKIDTNGNLCSPDKRPFYEAIDAKFNEATLTHDGNYLVVSNTDSLLRVFNFEYGLEPVAYYPECTVSLDTYYDYDCQYHLIISGDKHSIQRWTFCPGSLPQSLIRPLFDAIMKPLGQSNIIAQEIVGKKIGLYIDENLKVETDNFIGKIVTLNLSPDGNKILYTIKNETSTKITAYKICLYDVKTKQITEIVSSLTEFPNLVKFIQVQDELAIVFKQNDILCYIYKEAKIDLRETSNIINLHTINNKYVVGVTRDEIIKIWEMKGQRWIQLCQIRNTELNLHRLQGPHVCYSAINLKNNMIAILKSNYQMAIYFIGYNTSNVPGKLARLDNTHFTFNKKLTCCAFSPDDKFLAIGMDDGNISIFNIDERKAHEKELKLHCNSILQLQWAPLSVGTSILLSINCDELAWWNIALLENKTKKPKRSRTGIVRSSTVPLLELELPSNSQMRNSQTADANLSSASTSNLDRRINDINISNGNNPSDNITNGNGTRDNGTSSNEQINNEETQNYWALKTCKNLNRPALLGLIRLPPNCRAKVCVSSDFYKFLLVDVHGSINCFELFDVSSTV
ncbi:apoptotic protease-activating factor 1-like isoform X2 [Microplitis mediator]|uniref:apoptotic protease-activating factor 1-like isoform X2 n=1 Tax=Microplitis mediator TaxID=375433 RepID=UPI0025551253|nr:apoptotic protease-activating factor 1-like isoform X2 [Microplitis mediator]